MTAINACWCERPYRDHVVMEMVGENVILGPPGAASRWDWHMLRRIDELAPPHGTAVEES